MKKFPLVVLAAGMGSRYGGLKQIEPVGPSGETVLDYSVYDALKSGFNEVVFIIRRDFETVFRETTGRRFEKHTNVRYAFQQIDSLPPGCAGKIPPGREKPWGTGHAVWCARDVIDGPFAVINADDFYGLDSFRRLGKFLRGVADADASDASTGHASTPRARCCMVGFRLANTLSEHGAVARGICEMDANGRLLSVEECTAIERAPGIVAGRLAIQKNAGGGMRSFTGDEIVSMNCWGLAPSVLDHLERELAAFMLARGGEPKSEFYLPSFVTSLIRQHLADVTVLPTNSEWFGVTYREDRACVKDALAALVAAGAYPGRLWD